MPEVKNCVTCVYAGEWQAEKTGLPWVDESSCTIKKTKIVAYISSDNEPDKYYVYGEEIIDCPAWQGRTK